MAEQFNDIAITDLGTQVFWYNSTTSKFEYAFPVTAGAEFGGDADSYEANETDLDYTAKFTGRISLNDVEYTLNYTHTKYSRVEEITSISIPHVYMEVFSDGSAAIFRGTSAGPQVGSGDVREMTVTINPSWELIVDNVFKLDKNDVETLLSLQDTTGEKYFEDTTGEEVTAYSENETYSLRIDVSTVPTIRQKYYVSSNSTGA